MGKMDKEMIRLAAEAGAKAAMDKLEEERKKIARERVDRRLHNTWLLLKNYRLFKKHTENAVYQADQCDESIYDILELMERKESSDVVGSIKRSAARTATIVNHIDVMLNLYRAICENSEKVEEQRRWRVIKALYIDDKPVNAQKLADQEFVSKRTIERDAADACETLSTLIFGIDGVKRK